MNLFSFHKPVSTHFKYWIVTLFAIKVAGYFPEFIEIFYAQKLYPFIAVVNRFTYKSIPFSVGDIFYFFGVLYLIYLMFLIIKNIKKPLISLLKLSVYLLLVVWIFYLSWGFNYFRMPLAKQMNLTNQKYNAEQLKEITQLMINKTNRLQIIITKNDTLAVEIPYSIEQIMEKAPEGYQNIQDIIALKYPQACIKTSLLSKQISYMGVSGYLNPFTGEAQINRLFPKVFLPGITTHEMAHQLGFAPENEACFLGYLASTRHPDPYFQYSGYIDALRYCLIEIRKYDKNLYKEYMHQLHRGIMKNFSEARQFSEKYKFPIDFSQGYDIYLKMNKQASGIHSYNEVVHLLIAYHLQNRN